MFKLVKGEEADQFPKLEFSSFTEEVESAERKKRHLEEEFKSEYQKREAEEFILGGFDFEYGGGYRRDEILKKTSDEADAMIASAKARVAEIEKEGYEQGREEGRKQGREESFAEATSLMQALVVAVNELHTARNTYYGKAEKEMVDLVTLIASELVCREISQDPSIIGSVIRKAVGQLHAKQNITVRLNPADVEYGQKMRESLVRDVATVENVELKTDPAIRSGGCVIETNIGVIDATVETRILNIHKSLREQLEL
ncbi:MAG: hypothetical protein HZA04_09700 [Nitrospinae bacterium]|nr:hypothetical protein [Nitrospinota bacterium]